MEPNVRMLISLVIIFVFAVVMWSMFGPDKKH
jgi:hypothetical protein